MVEREGGWWSAGIAPVRSRGRRKGCRPGPICQRKSGHERAGRSVADEWGRAAVREGGMVRARARRRRWAEDGHEREWGSRGPESAEPRGGIFLFFFLFSLFFFLNSFSPLYKYSFMFPRCQNEILYVKCY